MIDSNIIISKAKNLLKEFEGFRDTAYYCSAGAKTIGYGFVIPEWDITKKMSKKEADILLDNKIAVLLRKLANNVPLLFKLGLPNICYSVLLSFIYNVGLKAFLDSTLLKRILDLSTASEIQKQFLRWNKASGKIIQGLINRRQKESDLFCQHYKRWKNEQYINLARQDKNAK